MKRECVVVQCGLLFVAMCAQAAGPLTAEIKPFALRPRTGAPETFEVRLDWAGPGLLEGAVELRFPFADEGTPQYRSHDLALTGGSQTFRLLVPTTTQGGGLSREVYARFVTKTGEFDLGRFDFGTGRSVSRNLTICVSKPPFGPAARKNLTQPAEVNENSPVEDLPLWQKLRPEQFEPGKATFNDVTLSTLPVFIETSDMPATALGYTPYDLIVLEGEGFTLLREKQLAAVNRWVLAGGSLFVESDAPLEIDARRFLEDLLAADVSQPVPAFDAAGRLDLTEGGGFVFARPGFGRLVITRPEQEVVDPNLKVATIVAWRKATTFLWKFREGDAAAVSRNGTWGWSSQPAGNERATQMAIANLLAPKQVRILPYPIVLLVLTAFVIVIGPLDWFVLGRLRMRRLTWVLFPLAAVGFTALTVFLAENYMGRNTYRSAFIITDLGHDGRVLRESRFEMIFPARNQEFTTDVRNALCVPMRTGMSSRPYGVDEMKLAAGRYEGLFPTRYALRQSLRQWTPQMNRLTSFEGGDDKSGVPWREFKPKDYGENLWRERWQQTIKDTPVTLCAIQAGVFRCALDNLRTKELIQALCQSLEKRPRILSQISPNGSASLDDLALVSVRSVWENSRTKPLPSVVWPQAMSDSPAGAVPSLVPSLAVEGENYVNATVVVRRDGEDFHVYRRLYAP